MDKKGAMTASTVITGIIGAVVLFIVAQNLFPVLSNSLGNLAATSGLPLASLFSPTGIIAILFAVGLFYGAYRLFWVKK